MNDKDSLSDESIFSELEEASSSSHGQSDNNSNDDPGESLSKVENQAEKNLELKSNKVLEDENVLPDEHDEDSSDEEDIRNTVGNIPMEWYADYPHIGYDWTGRKIMKPATGDYLTKFLERMDNENYWKTVKDKLTGQDVVLTDAELDVIQQIQTGKFPDKEYNPYQPWVDFFSYETMLHPVTNRPEHKRSFIPSKNEKEKVGKILHAIRMGWIKPRVPKDNTPKFYDLWKDSEQSTSSAINKKLQHFIPAPKLKPPGHEESYNPPSEYLLTDEEKQAWSELEPEKRKLNFIPEKYSCLRLVPAYGSFINERFERCLDLYLCPRQTKMRVQVKPEDLIPKLPKPKDLQPFPTTQAIVYKGHTNLVRCISVEKSGQFLASGSDDHTVRVWEIATGRCLCTLPVDDVVKDLAWCPNSSICLLAVVVKSTVLLLNPGVGDKLLASRTDDLLNEFIESSQSDNDSLVKWEKAFEESYALGFRLTLRLRKDASQISWHEKGDYFATVLPQGENCSVLIHQLSKQRSQNPFRKSKGLVQCVLFHPSRPYLFVATQRYVRIYNLLKQELCKKLLTNCKWVSSMAVHPQGDNVIIGSYDCKLSWFDLDLSTKPYRTLRHQKKAIRQVCFHKHYPLFASAADDGTVVVCHGMVYNDLLQNPLIVPVKILHGHKINNGLGVLDCKFHPTQPWLFSSGSDSTIRLYS